MRLSVAFMLLVLSQALLAIDYDQDKPFGFCTRSSRIDAASIYDVTGGGCYTYPIPKDFTGKVVVLRSNGQDMKHTIEEAMMNDENKVIILDGSNGEFLVSSNVRIGISDKTLLGINGARIRTKWYVTDEIRAKLDAAGVPSIAARFFSAV